MPGPCDRRAVNHVVVGRVGWWSMSEERRPRRADLLFGLVDLLEAFGRPRGTRRLGKCSPPPLDASEGASTDESPPHIIISIRGELLWFAICCASERESCKPRDEGVTADSASPRIKETASHPRNGEDVAVIVRDTERKRYDQR